MLPLSVISVQYSVTTDQWWLLGMYHGTWKEDRRKKKLANKQDRLIADG
jgi:hypothetical protein